jgi:TM2 domain-containing membrane protein YozV
VNYAPGYSAPPPHHGPPNYNHGPAGYPPAMSTTTYPPPHQAHGYGTGSSYPQPYGYGQHALVPTGHMVEPKSPAAASLLSAFFPGAGQLYNNEVGKGLFFFFSTLFLLVLPPLFLFPWLWGVFDAYATSRRINIQNSAPMGYLPP